MPILKLMPEMVVQNAVAKFDNKGTSWDTLMQVAEHLGIDVPGLVREEEEERPTAGRSGREKKKKTSMRK